MKKQTQIEREKAAGKQRLIVLLDKRELKALKVFCAEQNDSMTAIVRFWIVENLSRLKCLKVGK